LEPFPTFRQKPRAGAQASSFPDKKQYYHGSSHCLPHRIMSYLTPYIHATYIPKLFDGVTRLPHPQAPKPCQKFIMSSSDFEIDRPSNAMIEGSLQTFREIFDKVLDHVHCFWPLTRKSQTRSSNRQTFI